MRTMNIIRSEHNDIYSKSINNLKLSMRYTNEQVELYLSYLNPQSTQESDRRVRCRYCGCDRFWREMGYNWCGECYISNGHVLGYYDQKDYERFHFLQTSVYQRKYHYEKKIADISNKFGLTLTEKEKNCLYKRLMEIGVSERSKSKRDLMESLNNKFERKRMRSIYYLIIKILQEMGCNGYQAIDFKISIQTLEKYKQWWRY